MPLHQRIKNAIFINSQKYINMHVFDIQLCQDFSPLTQKLFKKSV